KREVRFRDPTGVREAVVNSVRRTLESGRETWQEQFRPPPPVAGVGDPGHRNAPIAPLAPSHPSGFGGQPVPHEFPNLETDFALRGHRSIETIVPPGRGIPEPSAPGLVD